MEQIIDNQEIDLKKKSELIKDMMFVIQNEAEGTDTAKWLEARRRVSPGFYADEYLIVASVLPCNTRVFQSFFF